MKQYKLIKRYPGLDPKVTIGDIALTQQGWGCYGVHNMRFGGWNEDYFAGFNEFWEEVQQAKFEIISYIEDISNRIFSKDHVGPMKEKYFQYSGRKMDYACMDGGWIDLEIGQPNRMGIHSVKRISDGEIFTIGDNIDGQIFKNTPITSIEINPTQLLFDTPLGTIGLDDSKHVIKSLFVTEDGADIYQGEQYFEVYKWPGDSTPMIYERIGGGFKLSNTVIFSTKQKAEEYIFQNKSCLSLIDILNNTVPKHYCSNKDYVLLSINALKEIIKSK